MNVKGRERELYLKFGKWNRVVSYHFLTEWKNNLLELIKNEHSKNKPS